MTVYSQAHSDCEVKLFNCVTPRLPNLRNIRKVVFAGGILPVGAFFFVVSNPSNPQHVSSYDYSYGGVS